ncbi:MAG: hypothetical protein AVDCRST_MAG15-2586 [uncultured Rubellimicrobium sp.]|uniref:Uncharacterized protein n=1 Tax=uncultured Rubellimicrobium sp. TaxID=543078 RepID=A0A6J4PW16_9RHOB|nr:MAG: hypothetical protein AVDCRST_MAG15-2586 [uncultured Rubellimicrobium sp.]
MGHVPPQVGRRSTGPVGQEIIESAGQVRGVDQPEGDQHGDKDQGPDRGQTTRARGGAPGRTVAGHRVGRSRFVITTTCSSLASIRWPSCG